MKKYIPILVLITVLIFFFYKTFFLFQIPFPGDLLISEYAPWKYESYLGYNPGSYPSKAQYFDVARQLYPWKMLAVDELKQGRIPLWNPYNFSGSPLLANNQSAVFNPFNLLFFVFHPPVAWSLYILVQPFLASLFTYLFLRQIKQSQIGSLTGGIAYGFSLFMSTFLEYGNFGHTIMWLPLALLLIEKAKERPGSVLLLPFVIAAIVFAGHFQLAVACIVFIASYIIFISRKKLHLFLLLFLGLGISAIQIIPTLELLLMSARSEHQLKVVLDLFLIQFHQLMLFISPDTYGNPATRNYLLTDTYPGNALYIGVVPFVFAVYSFTILKKSLTVKFFGVTSLLLVIFLTNNPFSVFFNSLKLPFFSSSSPSNFIFLLSFSLSVLAAIGISMWQKKKEAKLVLLWLAITLATLFLIGIHEIFGISYHLKLTFLGIGALFAAGIIIAITKFSHVKFGWYLLLLITVVELFYYFQKFNPFVPFELLMPQVGVIEDIKRTAGYDRVIGYKAASIESNFATLFKMYSPEGYDPLHPLTYNKYVDSSSRSDAMLTIAQTSQLNQLGVKYVLDRAENGSDETIFEPGKFKKIYEKDGWMIYKNLEALPRAYIKSENEVIPVNIVNARPGHYEVRKEKGKSGTLVISENYFPGWTAEVDGKKSQIKRINGVFIGVDVDLESLTILFSYKPQSFYLGLVLTIISIGVLALYFAVVKYIWK